MSAPPAKGPATAARTKQMLSIPSFIGLSRGGTETATIRKVPAATPAPPVPPIERPRMKTALFGARAQIAVPVSKMQRARRKIDLIDQQEYALPQKACVVAIPSIYAEPYHTTWSKWWNSSTMSGIAVEMMVESRDTRKALIAAAINVRTRRAPVTYFGSVSSLDGWSLLSALGLWMILPALSVLLLLISVVCSVDIDASIPWQASCVLSCLQLS